MREGEARPGRSSSARKGRGARLPVHPEQLAPPVEVRVVHRQVPRLQPHRPAVRPRHRPERLHGHVVPRAGEEDVGRRRRLAPLAHAQDHGEQRRRHVQREPGRAEPARDPAQQGERRALQRDRGGAVAEELVRLVEHELVPAGPARGAAAVAPRLERAAGLLQVRRGVVEHEAAAAVEAVRGAPPRQVAERRASPREPQVAGELAQEGVGVVAGRRDDDGRDLPRVADEGGDRLELGLAGCGRPGSAFIPWRETL